VQLPGRESDSSAGKTVFNGKMNSSDFFCGVRWKLECKFFTLSETSKRKRFQLKLIFVLDPETL